MTLEATESGYLVNQDDWDKDVAQAIAAADGLALTQDHWDVIEYLAKQPRHPQGHAGQVGRAEGG
jgi:tRNA 2-thiouridine synthesizing protein E